MVAMIAVLKQEDSCKLKATIDYIWRPCTPNKRCDGKMVQSITSLSC